MSNPLSKLLALGGGRRLRSYRHLVDRINALEDGMIARSDDELRTYSDDLRERAANGEKNANLLPEAFALMREASKRTIGLRHYDVQLIGAMALNDGCVAEMKTGEGKTLVATAACFLNALDGQPVHVVTVNDYLARRDAEWMGRAYRLLGMNTGLIQNGMKPDERRPAYAANVTYGTNSEYGFDYLRDNMVSDASGRVQRGHVFAVVDEADSVLIDEARTPLIISGQSGAPSEICGKFASIARQLSRDTDVVIDEKRRTIYETEEGLTKIEELFGGEIYADLSGATANRLRQALRAEFLFKLDRDYVVQNDEVKIVDSFTGRIMEGRRYSEGLHQAIEAKEHVKVQPETRTIATVTLQNYFRLYKKLSGMTGTALTADSELDHIYHMPVVVVPTNKPLIRTDHHDLIYRTAEAKFNAVADEIERRHTKGQPVLVGTASVAASERLSKLLNARGIPHQVLNAKEHEREAHIVAEAGRLGAVTVSTNMAGRGTDILLGGNFDELKARALAKFDVTDEAEALDWQLDAAEKEARYIIDREGYAVRQFGGLCVIGTERHEARRIDNQLRGRSGRQGDPGESQFFLSLEDDLLRLFGQDRLHKVSEMMINKGIPDDDPLEDELVSKVITTAQQQVESMHFAARKSVLEYDDVMDKQRKSIYAERNAILDGKDVFEHLPEYVEDVVDELLDETCPPELPADDWDLAAVETWANTMTRMMRFRVVDEAENDESTEGEALSAESNEGEVADAEPETADAESEAAGTEPETADAESEAAGTEPETADAEPEIVGFPTFDTHPLDCDEDPDSLREALVDYLMSALNVKQRVIGEALFSSLCTQVMLRVMDTHWVSHLTDMEAVKAGIGLRAYGHRDPLVEYKDEAYRTFSDLVSSIYEDTVRSILYLPVDHSKLAPAGLSEEENPYNPKNMVYSNSGDVSAGMSANTPDPSGGNPLG